MSKTGSQNISHQSLKIEFDGIRTQHRENQPFVVRIHRTLSWLQRSEQEHEDQDAAFIFLWIAFDAIYGSWDMGESMPPKASQDRKSFFSTLCEQDQHGDLEKAIWERFSNLIRTLLANKYAYPAFWAQQRTGQAPNWQEAFTKEQRKIQRAMSKRQTNQVLELIFHRLYVIRNQLIHGGATWQGSLNRSQIQDGEKILRFIVPLFIRIMMRAPQKNWGQLAYPPIDQK